MISRYKKAFTLVEMLIVIVIIGILAAALIPRLQSLQGRARDTKRKSDLRTIAQTLEIYKTDNGFYPLPQNCASYGTAGVAAMCYRTSSSNNAHYIQSITGTYITSLPLDPLNAVPNAADAGFGALGTGWYFYYYGNVYNAPYHSFNLVTLLENTKDPDICRLNSSSYKWEYWGQGTALCGNGSPYLYEALPYSR